MKVTSAAWVKRNPDKASAHKRKWHAANREKQEANRRARRADPAIRTREYRQNRLRKFKITEQRLAELWEAQGRRCYICEVAFDNPFAGFIDHSHKTGEVRGLLCSQCNTGLGMFRDSVTHLARAIQYLQHNAEDLI